MTQQLSTRLSDFICTELLNDGRATIAPDTDLLSTDTIDSIGVMQLVAFIEKDLGITVAPQDVTFDNFVTIDALSRYLETRQGA